VFNRARWGLTLWFAAFLAVILLVLGVAVYASARRSLFHGVNSDLAARAAPITERAHGGAALRELTVGPAFTAGGYFYAAASLDGTLLGSSGNVDPEGLPQPEDVRKAAEKGLGFADTRSSDGDRLRVLLVPLDLRGVQGIVLEVGRSTEPEHQALSRLLFILGAGGGLGLLLATAAGFLLAGRALRPIQKSLERQRAFVADASHELRTPLALIRANAEVLKRRREQPVDSNISSVDDIIAETDRLSGLVGRMLKLARADTGEPIAIESEVDLRELTLDTAREMRRLAEPRGISIGVEADGSSTSSGQALAKVRGDESLLRELVTVLLDNSIKYSHEGASVTVGVQPGGGQVMLTVADTGRGIPPESLPRIFDRFYRVDKARAREMGGAGLGLAIAKSIVDAHHGSIGIKSRVGEGTTVTVELPAAPASA
jgi:signal transduction histidine kinase